MATRRNFVMYRNYSFAIHDPVIEAMRDVMRSERIKHNMAHQITGVATQTFDNWFSGKTRTPRNATVTQAMGGLGWVRHDKIDERTGAVRVGFEQGRKIDREKEVELQTAFFLKTHPLTKKKPRRKKTNGKA